MPLIERDYMRNPARTRREQRRRGVRFSMPPLLPLSRRTPPAAQEDEPRMPPAAQEDEAQTPDRRRFWVAYAAIVLSVGVIGAFVAIAVREAL